MATLISDLREFVRFVAGDNDDQNPIYQPTALDRGIRFVIKGNYLPNYALMVDNLSITPDLTDPNQFLLLVYTVAKRFMVAEPDGQSSRTRAYSERIGNFRDLIFDIEKQLYLLENGTMFASWQSLADFLEGYAGVRNVFQHLSRLKLAAPFTTSVLSVSGLNTDSGSNLGITPDVSGNAP